MKIEGEFVLGQGRDETRVNLEAELMPQSWFRLLAPLVIPVIQKQNVAAGERLKRILTTEAPARVE